MKIKVSIITVAFNADEHIADAINSVINQTYADIEYIVIDGDSTDLTAGIVRSFGNKISKFVSEKDAGIFDAMNKGINISSGDVIGMLNSDDLLYDKHVISRIVNTFEENKIDCCYGNYLYVARNNIDEVVRICRPGLFKVGLFEKSWTPGHMTFYCKKDIYSRYGAFDSSYELAADNELMFRFIEKEKIHFYYLDTFIAKMRINGASTRDFNSTIQICKEMKRALTVNGGNFNILKYLLFKMFKMSEYIKPRL